MKQTWTPLFSETFPEHAEALNACIERYMQRWFDEWFEAGIESYRLGRTYDEFRSSPNTRQINEDTWTRDLTAIAMVFMVERRFNVTRQYACELVKKGFDKRPRWKFLAC